MMRSGSVRGHRSAVNGSTLEALGGLLLLILAGHAAPPPLAAQALEEEDYATPTELEIYAFGGALHPLANLTFDDGSFGTAVSPDVVLGAELTYWFTERLGIGVVGAFSPADLQPVATQFQGAIPDSLGSATYVAALGALTYRIASGGSARALEPYFSVGAGLRHIDTDPIAQPEAESSTDPALTVAGGIRVPVTGSLWMRGELRDIASTYESPTTGDSRIQNDITVSLGVGVRFP